MAFASTAPATVSSRGPITSLCRTSAGTLWVGMTQGLLERRDGRFTSVGNLDGKPDPFVNAIAPERGGHDGVWVGTNRGVVLLNAAGVEVITRSDGLSRDVVRSLLEDSDGNVWIGTSGGGLNRIRSGIFAGYGTRQGLRGEETIAICAARRGGVWVGMRGGELARIREDGAIESEDVVSAIGASDIMALWEDRAGNLWIGTWLGLFRRGPRGGVPVRIPQVEGTVRAIFEDGESEIWVGTDGNGVFTYRAGRVTHLTPADGIPNKQVRAFLQSRDGAVWIATLGGVVRWDRGSLAVFTTRDGLPSNLARALYEDRTGRLWVGTLDAGIAWREPEGLFRTQHSQNRETMGAVFSITQNLAGDFWVSCNHGVVRIASNEIADVLAGRKGAVQPSFFDESDGLPSRECNGGSPGVALDSEGSLWYPTIEGVARLRPDENPAEPAPSRIRLERVIVDDHDVPAERPLVLPPGAHRMAIEYTALGGDDPGTEEFRYRLEGLDTDWVALGTRRSVSFSPLSAGRYRFRLMARDERGSWRDSRVSFAIVVRPHLYETAWFRTSAAVLLIGAVLAGIRRRSRVHVRRVKELATTVRERTAEIEQGRQFLDATIDALTQAVAACDENGNPVYANDAMRRLSRDTGELALFSADGMVRLSPEEDPLRRARAGASVSEEELTCVAPDGSQRAVLATARPIQASGGGSAGAVLALHDITERKKGEEALRRAETTTAMGMIVAGVAHEVRNPLFAISAMVDAFGLRYGDREEYRRLSDGLQAQILRLNALVGELVDFTRSSTPKDREVLVADLAADAAASVAEFAAASRVRVAAEPVSPDLRVQVDRSRVLQAMHNVLENAIQHSPPGGTVFFRCERGPGDRVAVRVRDEGKGFAEDDLPHVLAPFFTKRHGGRGLGLAIARRAVELEGGRIEAANHLDGGACVTLEIPAL